jgi:hypothetical protein
MGGDATGEAASSPYTYRYVSPGKDFRIELRFRKTEVERHMIAAALREAAENVDRD